MNKLHNQDPLHGITLKALVESLVEKYGWDELASRIKINCFSKDPSINSTLKFLRKTSWARKRVEELYIKTQQTQTKENPYKKSTK